jgi:hypothetical protein
MESISKYIDCYKKNRAAQLIAELNWFAMGNSITEIIEKAASSPKLHPHQRRVGKKKLKCKSKKLLAIECKIAEKTDFDELHKLIKDAKVRGVGELTNYDIALRISWYLYYVKKVKNILPKKVYLHSGTRKGAKILAEILDVSILSKPLDKENSKIFGELKPYQIEDFLCVCKGCFGGKNEKSKCCPKNCGC